MLKKIKITAVFDNWHAIKLNEVQRNCTEADNVLSFFFLFFLRLEFPTPWGINILSYLALLSEHRDITLSYAVCC